MSERRVVITGMGWVTPLGHDVDAVWARLLRGDSGVGPVTRFDASTFSTNFAAEVRGFKLGDFLPARRGAASGRGRIGLNSQFALAAAAGAWRQAGLDRFAGLNPRRMGIYLGAGDGQLDSENLFATNLAGWDAGGSEGGASRAVDAVAWAKAAYERLDARREVEQEPNMTLAHLAGEFGCRGPASNCMTACAASTQAIGEAFEIIRRGDADAMFAGGTHSMIHPLGMTGFIRLTAMSGRRETPATAARPFDSTRDGFVMGEGAGMLVLEALDHYLARTRGKTGSESRGTPTALAEVVGYGSSADAFRITDIQPQGRGARAAMLQALRQAGIDPREPEEDRGGDGSGRGDGAPGRPRVHYISAHGTGTKENDSTETSAVKGVFGALAPRVPFSSVKSMLGHLIQAAGAVELITCVQAIRTGWVPPTMNLAHADPACDLDYVPNSARDMSGEGGVDVCLSNSFGFGGQNDTLCVRGFHE